MAFWDQLKARVTDLTASLKTNVSKFQNKEFANGSMAMCALIAAADGSITYDERQKTSALIRSNDVLSVFDSAELQQKFDFYSSKLEKDYEFGKIESIATLGKLKGKPDQARAVVQIGIIIGGADGNFDPHEKGAVREACHAMNLNPAEFDL